LGNKKVGGGYWTSLESTLASSWSSNDVDDGQPRDIFDFMDFNFLTKRVCGKEGVRSQLRNGKVETGSETLNDFYFAGPCITQR
jgi:hypothetical protein